MSGDARLGEEPSGLPPAALGDAFSAPDRAAALRGINLTPRTPDPAADAPANEPTPTSAAERVTSRAAPRRGGAVVVYLPASVRDRLRAHTTTSGGTYTDTVLDAIDACHARLGQIVHDSQAGRRPGSLFQGRRRVREHHDEPQIQVTLRPARRDLSTIDRLVREHRASSRSSLIARVLDAFLTHI